MGGVVDDQVELLGHLVRVRGRGRVRVRVGIRVRVRAKVEVRARVRVRVELLGHRQPLQRGEVGCVRAEEGVHAALRVMHPRCEQSAAECSRVQQ